MKAGGEGKWKLVKGKIIQEDDQSPNYQLFRRVAASLGAEKKNAVPTGGKKKMAVERGRGYRRQRGETWTSFVPIQQTK